MTVVLIILAAWIAPVLLLVAWLSALAAKDRRAFRARRQEHYEQMARFAAGEWDTADELAAQRDLRNELAKWL